jgi:hypothetical protein
MNPDPEPKSIINQQFSIMRSLNDKPFGGRFSGGNNGSTSTKAYLRAHAGGRPLPGDHNFASDLRAEIRKNMGGGPLPGDHDFASNLRAEVDHTFGRRPSPYFNPIKVIPNPHLDTRPRDNSPNPKALVDLIMSDSEEEIETPAAVEQKPKAKYIPKNRNAQKPKTDADLNPIPWRDTNDRDMRRINASKSPGYTPKGVTAKSVEKKVKARDIKPKDPKEPTYLALAKLDGTNSTKNTKDAKGREQSNDFQE